MVLHVRDTKNPSEWCDCCDVMTAERWLATGRSDSIYDVTPYDVKRSRDLFSTNQKVAIPNYSPVPGSDSTTGSYSPDPGSDSTTGSYSPDSRKWPRDRKSRMNPSTASQTQEMTARPEGNNEPFNCFPDPGNDRATGSQEMIPIVLYCSMQ